MKQDIENESNEKIWDEIYNGFQNDVCLHCRWYTSKINHRPMSNPQPLLYVGPKFKKDKYGLMFVGIETYSNAPFKKWEKIEYDQDFTTERVKELYLWTERGRKRKEDNDTYSPFWGWVREISSQVIDSNLDEAFKHIAYSNLIKCQSRKKAKDFNEPDSEYFEAITTNCIQKNNWIYKEIEKIKPKNVILFSGNDDNHHYAKLFLNDSKGIIIKKSKHKNGFSDLFTYINDGKRNYFVTRHPRGTDKMIQERIIGILRGEIRETPMDWKLC